MIHTAQWLVPSVVAIASTAGTLTLAIMIIRMMQKLMEMQNRMIRSLSNLAASKDLAAFTSLESMQQIPTEPFEYAPMDDQSVAERMAQNYIESGMDPMHAYAQDDPLADFGGTEAFR